MWKSEKWRKKCNFFLFIELCQKIYHGVLDISWNRLWGPPLSPQNLTELPRKTPRHKTKQYTPQYKEFCGVRHKTAGLFAKGILSDFEGVPKVCSMKQFQCIFQSIVLRSSKAFLRVFIRDAQCTLQKKHCTLHSFHEVEIYKHEDCNSQIQIQLQIQIKIQIQLQIQMKIQIQIQIWGLQSLTLSLSIFFWSVDSELKKNNS